MPAGAASLQVNLSLGLTFYCSKHVRPRRPSARSCRHSGGVGAAGRKTTVDEITGSVAEPRAPSTEAEWRGALETYGNRYRANPSDAKAAIAYAKALRATDQRAQAVAVLQQASIRNPHDTAVLGADGRALADAGH